MSLAPITKKDLKKKRDISENVYMTNLLTRKIYLPFKYIGKNIIQNLERKLKFQLEGKCSIEGYIKPDSIKIISYSSGLMQEENIVFEVAFECNVCCPVEGMLIKCNVKNITQAGIRAVLPGDISPVIIYVSKDHHLNNKNFSNLKEDEEIIIRVIGQRYELNDKNVSVIGELVNEKKIEKTKKKPKLIIKD